MAGWSVQVCPKCHALAGEDKLVRDACPRGCERPKTVEEAAEHGGLFGEMQPIQCIAIDVAPTQLGTVALINAMTGYPIIP
jgi:hypothetical protein